MRLLTETCTPEIYLAPPRTRLMNISSSLDHEILLSQKIHHFAHTAKGI